MTERNKGNGFKEEKQNSPARVEDPNYRLKGGLFLFTVAGIGGIFGFSRTLVNARKHDQKLYEKGFPGSAALMESGSSLALRALGWGTLYAVIGTGTICYGIWKLSGAKNMDEFRYIMGTKLPKIPKNDPPQSETEFSGLTDLLKYVSAWGRE